MSFIPLSGLNLGSAVDSFLLWPIQSVDHFEVVAPIAAGLAEADALMQLQSPIGYNKAACVRILKDTNFFTCSAIVFDISLPSGPFSLQRDLS